MNRTILQGDVLEKLKEVTTESIDCIISSPPYWGLRDYGVEGQLGLEPDFRDYLKTMSKIMDELKRVLKNTGSCWINLGDTYAGHVGPLRNPGYTNEKDRNEYFVEATNYKDQYIRKGLQAKSRFGIPERFYINCIDSGWIARNHIPWYKSNSMPSSIKDRFTNKWESIFFFVKNQKYYFNLDAVREPCKTISKPFNVRVRESKKGLTQQKLLGGMSEEEDQNYNSKGELKQDSTYNGLNEKWKDRKYNEQTINKTSSNGINTETGEPLSHPKGKNPGDVFFINPRPFAEAHFATFPVDLPLKILKCACPQQVCSKCGIPRYPIREVVGHTITNSMRAAGCDENGLYHGQSTKDYKSNKAQNASDSKRSILKSMSKIEKITGYTKCSCNEKFKPGVVLDPFFGAGTVGVAAEQLGLEWVGIELNDKYTNEIAKPRLDKYKNEKL